MVEPVTDPTILTADEFVHTVECLATACVLMDSAQYGFTSKLHDHDAALRAALEATQRERDDWKQSWVEAKNDATEEYERVKTDVTAAEARAVTAEAERDRLQEALRRYGWHRDDCPARWGGQWDDDLDDSQMVSDDLSLECTCEFRAALAGVRVSPTPQDAEEAT
jgi:hypothetical protein